MKKIILLSAAALTMAGCSGAVDNAKDHLDIQDETNQAETQETSAQHVNESSIEIESDEEEKAAEDPNKDSDDDADAESNDTRTDQEVIDQTDWHILSWEELARNADEHNGKLIRVEGKIQSLNDDGNNYIVQLMMFGEVDHPVIISIPTYATDTLLEGDYVVFYGMSVGNTNYQTVIGANKTAPSMWGMYMTW